MSIENFWLNFSKEEKPYCFECYEKMNKNKINKN